MDSMLATVQPTDSAPQSLDPHPSQHAQNCPPPPALRSSQHGGFTLIELLVVVAIIALLISILLPSLSRAREQAKALVCMSQLKQMGNAFMMYVDEWDDRMPMHRRGNPLDPGDSSADTGKWSVYLRPYLIDDGMLGSPGMAASVGAIYRCPSNPDGYGGHPDPAKGLPVPGYDLNYVYNGWGLVKYAFTHKRYNSIESPSERIVITDGWLGGYREYDVLWWTPWYYSIGQDWQILPPIPGKGEARKSQWKNIAMLHVGDTANIMWADGHVNPEISSRVDDNYLPWSGKNE